MKPNKDTLRAKWREQFHNRTPAKPKTGSGLIVRASADLNVTEMLVYDEIGPWGITAKDFVSQLAGISTPGINVRINSPGGDVFDGIAIYSALKVHPSAVTTSVDGWAASAASIVAMAGKSVSIAENAVLMIHRAWSFAIGNSADMTDMANTLNKIDGQLAAIYAKKTGRSADDMMALMAGEVDGTWFTAEEALGAGFVDALTGADVEPDDDTAETEEEQARVARIMNMRRRLAIAGVE